MTTFKVCFYDKKKDALVEIEDFSGSSDSITYTSLILTSTYQSGKHRMPSSIWLAFNSEDVLRVFFLEANPQPDNIVLDRINELVQEIRCH